MFKCKVCAEKDNRITDLKSQIDYFKSVLHPAVKESRYIPPQEMEQDVVLSGGVAEEVTLPQDQVETPEILLERERMLSGSY